MVDKLAKDSTHLPLSAVPGCYGASLAYLARRSKEILVKDWTVEWKKCTFNGFAHANHIPPSPKTSALFKSLNRAEYSSFCQFLTGHGFFGEYKARFRPNDINTCQCDDTTLQTREHLM